MLPQRTRTQIRTPSPPGTTLKSALVGTITPASRCPQSLADNFARPRGSVAGHERSGAPLLPFELQLRTLQRVRTPIRRRELRIVTVWVRRWVAVVRRRSRARAQAQSHERATRSGEVTRSVGDAGRQQRVHGVLCRKFGQIVFSLIRVSFDYILSRRKPPGDA
jgi:hypothetical protein